MASLNPYRYAGYRYDNETGLYYLIARYYDPINGVFISVDPVPGNDDDSATQNIYSYAKNNPVMYVDPDGNFPILQLIGAAIGAYAGYQFAKYMGFSGWKMYAIITAGAAIGALAGWLAPRLLNLRWFRINVFNKWSGGDNRWGVQLLNRIKLMMHEAHAKGPHNYPHLQLEYRVGKYWRVLARLKWFK